MFLLIIQCHQVAVVLLLRLPYVKIIISHAHSCALLGILRHLIAELVLVLSIAKLFNHLILVYVLLLLTRLKILGLKKCCHRQWWLLYLKLLLGIDLIKLLIVLIH